MLSHHLNEFLLKGAVFVFPYISFEFLICLLISLDFFGFPWMHGSNMATRGPLTALFACGKRRAAVDAWLGAWVDGAWGVEGAYMYACCAC